MDENKAEENRFLPANGASAVTAPGTSEKLTQRDWCRAFTSFLYCGWEYTRRVISVCVCVVDGFVFPKHTGQQRAELINHCVYPESAEALTSSGQAHKNPKRVCVMVEGRGNLL